MFWLADKNVMIRGLQEPNAVIPWEQRLIVC